MPEASNSITIKRPIGEVFAFLANPENDVKWRSGILELSHISGDGAGARYHQVISGPGGRKVNADIEITEYVPDKRIAFRTTSGPVQPVGAYEFSQAGEGTDVRFNLSAEIGGIKRMVMGSMVQRTMTAEVGRLAELKRLLEGQGPKAS